MQEVGTLRSTLDREVEVKDRAQQQVEEVSNSLCYYVLVSACALSLLQLKQLNERVSFEVEQRETAENKCQGVRQLLEFECVCVTVLFPLVASGRNRYSKEEAGGFRANGGDNEELQPRTQCYHCKSQPMYS